MSTFFLRILGSPSPIARERYDYTLELREKEKNRTNTI